MHSNRMRTVRCSGLLMVGVSVWGVSAQGGVHAPWTEFLTHACENITFLQLRLRTVKIRDVYVRVCAQVRLNLR